MKNILISVVTLLVNLLDEDTLKKMADAVIDVAEKAVLDSENTFDDALVLPLCAKIRSTFNIPDNDS